jgi:hypothetical protein
VAFVRNLLLRILAQPEPSRSCAKQAGTSHVATSPLIILFGEGCIGKLERTCVNARRFLPGVPLPSMVL